MEEKDRLAKKECPLHKGVKCFCDARPDFFEIMTKAYQTALSCMERYELQQRKSGKIIEEA